MSAPVRAEAVRPAATSRTALLRLLGVVVLCAPAVLGFRAAFGTDRALVTAGVGVLLGAVVGWLSAARQLSAILTTAALIVVGALAAGPAALPATTTAGLLPTATTFRELAVGVIRSWRELLTATAPTGVLGDLLLVPYLTALFGGVLAVVLALRTRVPGWAVVPPAAVLLVSVLVGTQDAVSPLVQGGVFAVLSVVWLATTARSWSRPDPVRATAAVALLVAAAAAAAVLGPAVTDAGNRFVLRDRVEPPLDIRAYQSPLNGFRRYVKDQHDTTLFTVTGAPKGSRVRLATMDAYDGTVWNVAGSTGGTTGSSGSFRRLPVATGTDPATVSVHVTVDGFSGVWLPDMGDLRSVTFTGPRAAQLGDDFRYNTATGTGIVTDGLQKGDGYSFSADVPRQPSAQALAHTSTTALIQPQLQNVPPVVTSLAADSTDEAKNAYTRAQAIAQKLRTTGYFSDGLPNQVASRAGHGAGRLADMFGAKIWIGDQEQYSAAAALMARQLGLPTRVVMGFDVPGAGSNGAATIKGSDVTAWIEVAFQGAGWVSFDVTPDENRTPPDQVPQPAPKPKPATQQPPPPIQQPPPQQPASGSDQGKQDTSPSHVPAWLGAVLTVAAWIGTPLLFFALICALIVGLKLRRRRRRRRLGTADRRVAAGWSEVLDAHRDHGAVLPRSATRREIAGSLGRSSTSELAQHADGAVFAGGVVTDDQAAQFWGLVDRELADLGSGGFRARWRGRLSLRSLLRRNP